MRVNSALAERVFSAMPLLLVAVADVVFLGSLGSSLDAAALVLQCAIPGVAALIVIPHSGVRVICSLLLATASILGMVTIGRFYLPALCAAVGLTIWQLRIDRDKRERALLHGGQ